jgi:hypothetical protein
VEVQSVLEFSGEEGAPDSWWEGLRLTALFGGFGEWKKEGNVLWMDTTASVLLLGCVRA